ncbi:MAG: ribosomal biogenesis protein [Thermoplasmata archaeon]
MFLITTWFGTFLCEDHDVVKYKLFPKNAMEIAKRLKAIEDRRILEEEKEISQGIDGLLVAEERLKHIESAILTDKKITLPLPPQYNFPQGLLRDASVEFAKLKTKIEFGAADRHIIQAVNAIDDLSKSANLIYERLQEWYGLHFPEIYEKVSPCDFADLISKCNGDRETILKNLPNTGITISIGSEISEKDKTAIVTLAKTLKELYETKTALEKYIKESMENIAPNVSYIAGSNIGARLMSYTNGLKRLAAVPSSTVQLLGAEKALFRFLKEGGRPPKHGIIFQHPTIHGAPYWQRGKLARALASKITIAARVDANSDKFIGEDLEKALQKRVEEIKKKYPNPPLQSSRKKFQNPPPRAQKRQKEWKKKRRFR